MPRLFADRVFQLVKIHTQQSASASNTEYLQHGGGNHYGPFLGNERADSAAKAALSLPISPVKISVTDFLPRAKLLMLREWQKIWNCCDGNKLHAINSTVGVTKLNGSLSRKDAVIINRLQIGHTRAIHAHLNLGGDDEACCTTCYTSLTVNHILMECPQFNYLRQQYHFGSTLKELFNNTSVDDIIAFIKDTHFYTRI